MANNLKSHNTETSSRRLRDSLRKFLFADNVSRARLRNTLEPLRKEGVAAFLFGGLLRDLLLGLPPRDVDIVIADEHIDSIYKLIGGKICHRNKFGGLKIINEGWEFDIWPVSQTWAFRQNGLWRNKSFEELPLTTFLNVEAVAVELWPTVSSERIVYERGFYEAFENRMLELNYAENPRPDFCVARSLFIASKLRFGIGPELTQYISEHAKHMSIAEIRNIQKGHYKIGVLTVGHLERLLSQVHWSADWQTATRLDCPTSHYWLKNVPPYQLELWPVKHCSFF